MLKTIQNIRSEVIEDFLQRGESDILTPKQQKYIQQINDVWVLFTGEDKFPEVTKTRITTESSEETTETDIRTKRGIPVAEIAKKMQEKYGMSHMTAYRRIGEAMQLFNDIKTPSIVWKFYFAMRFELLAEEAREIKDYKSAERLLTKAEKLRSEAAPESVIDEEYTELDATIVSPDVPLERLGLDKYNKHDLMRVGKEQIKKFKVPDATKEILEEELELTLGVSDNEK